MLQQPSPIKQPVPVQEKLSEMPKTPSLQLPSSSATPLSKSPGKSFPATKAINRRSAAVTRLRRIDPRKNLLMKPKAPPIMISGNEAKIATRLMQPIYYGELVVNKKPRKGFPPVRARLIGGKIVKPYTKLLSVMYTPKRQKPSRKALRRMANERSFTITREIERGERPPFNNAKMNLSEIQSSQPNLPNILLTPSTEASTSSKKVTKKPLNTSSKHRPLQSRTNYIRRQHLPFRRTFFPFSIKPQFYKEKEKAKPKELSEEEKKERMETIKILNNIPWRTLPKKSKSPMLPRIWHPPIQINKGWIVLPKTHSLCRPIPFWHPPLLWPPKTLIAKRKKLFKIDGKIDFFLHPSSNEGIIKDDDVMEVDNNNMQKRIHFAVPLMNIINETNQEIDLTKVVFDPNANPKKSIFAPKKFTDLPSLKEEKEAKARKKIKNKNSKNKSKSKSKKGVKNERRAKSPPLVKKIYQTPTFRVPSLRPPPPPTQEPSEPDIPIDLAKNSLNNQKKIVTRLDEQKCVDLLYEYRLAQVRQTQPKNMWEANNQKMIELMKTKGAGIDSAVREDAGKALKFLEEKASKLTGKHSEIRNRLLQFCVDYGYEYSYEENDNYFYLKIGDFTVQLELQDYLVKNAWFFWSNIEPIFAPHIAKMFCRECWAKIHQSIDRMRHIIPTSITSEEKDLVLRALCCMERDLVRYYEKVEFRSHIFALNDILVRTDIYPFSIILPRSPVEIIKNESKIHSALDKFEKVKNIATLQIQISPLERHKFCIQSSLTPLNHWASPDTYKVGARFVIKFAKPIPIRYGAIKQLESIIGDIISKENYVNVYKYISLKQHGREVLFNLSDYSKQFVMYFDFDQFDKETRNDTILNGFYIDKASQLISAMYIIKREYILNRLCESTCENNPDLIEWRYLSVKNKKIPIKIRLSDIYDGHLCLYFQYRCYLIEARIIIRPSGNVGLGRLKIVHHGNKLDTSYHTVSRYQTFIDEWHLTDSVYLKASQLSDLNGVLQNTWHIPAFVDQLIKFIKNRCADNNVKEIHAFKPVYSSDRNERKKKSAKTKDPKPLEIIHKKKQKPRKSCKKGDGIRKNGDNDDEDDPSKDSNNKKQRKENPSKNGKRRSSGKSKGQQQKKNNAATATTSTTTKNDGKKMNKNAAVKLKMKRKNGKIYKKQLKRYFRNSIKNVLKRYKKVHLKALLFKKNKMVTTTIKKMHMKSKKQFKQSNVYRRFKIRKQLHQKKNYNKSGDFRRDRKKRSLLKPRMLNKEKHGSAWNDFVSKVNDNNEEMYKAPQKILTWPMLADQRVIRRFSNTKIKGDPHMDEAGRIEELDEYFNVSDCEESEQVCSYSYIPRKIVPPLPQRFRNMPATIDNTIGRLKPQIRKYLGKFKLKQVEQKENEKKSPEKEKDAEEAEEKEKEDETEDSARIQWGENWKQEDFMEIYKAAKERPLKKRRKRRIKHLLRPTSFKFISIINRDKQKSQGIFPYKVLRHAAICLRDGPYRGEPRKFKEKEE
uniref:Uncharacterized protein n=1 Tax=Panagrolaimus superbus TaxID=310955 RepID=A0A914Z336_9BILA